MFRAVAATAAEQAAALPGDDLVPHADAVMDRAFDVPAPPDVTFRWLAQLGKGRAGWYLPRSVERFVPRRNRAIRAIDERWQHLAVGTVIPDYGGPHETFTVALLEPPGTLVYVSERGRMQISWAISLTPQGSGTRVHLRLRLGPVKRKWLVNSVGELFDLLTIAGMAAGLRERLTERQ